MRIQNLTSDESSERMARALRKIPGIYDAAVTARVDSAGETKRVAYLVTDPSTSSHWPPDDGGESKDTFTTIDYWMRVTSIPLTHDGEIDLNRLSQIPIVDDAMSQQLASGLASTQDVEWAVTIESGTAEHHARPLRAERGEGTFRLRSSAEAAPAIISAEPTDVPSGAATTLVDTLLRTAASNPQGVCASIDRSGALHTTSYKSLLGAARSALGALQRMDIKPGDRVVVACEAPQSFFVAFWGCILGGAIPVPVNPPVELVPDDPAIRRLLSAQESLRALAVISDDQHARLYADVLNSSTRALSMNDLQSSGEAGILVSPDPEDTAVMLLTSGSTGKPKVVMQSHKALLAQARSAIASLELTGDDVSLNWFPLDHVGGIVMFHLRDLLLGADQFHSRPDPILKDPLLWLDWIDRFDVSITWAPNFASSLVTSAHHRADKRNWDLRRLRVVVNAGEAIVRSSASDFARLLHSYGASERVMRPAWGMSETCSAVTYGVLEPQDSSHRPVSIGRPISDLSARIINESGLLVAEGEVGRLQVHGPVVTKGYFDNASANRDSFTEDGWFRTGDLAFIRDGEITITGREKDVIIVNGLNVYCQEVESVAESVEGVAPSYTAAVATKHGGSEQVALLYVESETEKSRQSVKREIRRELAQRMSVYPSAVIAVKHDQIPKTAIGKIQRGDLAEKLASGGFASELAEQEIALVSSGANGPSCFIRNWHRRRYLPSNSEALEVPTVVMADAAGLGSALAELIGAANCILVRMGGDFEMIDGSTIIMDPTQDSSFRRLCAHIQRRLGTAVRVVHCWAYGERTPIDSDVNRLWREYELGFGSINRLVQNWHSDLSGLDVWTISSDIQPIGETETAYERSSILALADTLSAEHPGLTYRHIDIAESREVDSDADDVARIILADPSDEEIVLKQGKSMVPGLELIELPPENSPNGLKQGGTYLVAGGMGGIGRHIVTRLTTEFECSVLAVGRRKPEELEPGVLDEMMRVGNITYRSVDITDYDALINAINLYESDTGATLDGIINLAGSYESLTVQESDLKSAQRVLSTKLVGTWNLHRIVTSRPDLQIVHASSAVTLLHGAGTGLYAVANHFVESLSDAERSSGIRSTCISWGIWRDVGISRESAVQALMERRGYVPMQTSDALDALTRVAGLNEVQLWTGLNPQRPDVSRLLRNDPQAGVRLVVRSDAKFEEGQRLKPQDPFGIDSDVVWLSAGGEGSHLATSTHASRRGSEGQTEIKVQRIWQEVLDRESVHVDENFFELGGTSLSAALATSSVERDFGIQLQVTILMSHPTVASLAEHIDSKIRGVTSLQSNLIVPLQTQGAKTPFFGVHPLFGLVYPYAELARMMKPSRPFYAIQARGFSAGEHPLRTINEMASLYISEMKRVQPSGPYYIGGWSLGSLIALEMAQQLHKEGEDVERLIIIDQATDSVDRFLDEIPLRVQAKRFGSILREAFKSFQPQWQGRNMGWILVRHPRLASRFFTQVLAPMLRVGWRNKNAATNYVIEEYPGRISLLHTGDPEFTRFTNPELGWDRVALKGVDVHRIPGAHFTLHESPHVEVLAEAMATVLEG